VPRWLLALLLSTLLPAWPAVAALPVFVELTGGANPLAGVDAGKFSAAGLGDLDGDRDLDLVAGNQDGTLLYFENTGGAASPAFTEQSGSASPLDGLSVIDGFSTPALVDLDGDGDLDLVVGAHTSGFHYFENTGTPSAAIFVERTGAANRLGGLAPGEVPEPAFADLDGDGDLDLVAGTADGTFHYFENTGTRELPSFVERTGAANPFDGLAISAYSTASLADVDGDGDLDLVSGAPDGSFHYFENTGTPQMPAFSEQTGTANPLDGLAAGAFSTGSFANLYGDPVPAVVAGMGSGGFAVFRAPEPDPMLEGVAAALALLALGRRR